jgi:hypothetical protein|tara:strand:+ start:139 stop:525 length:387 start_codon:yes stop_codon:yes gene_type:complete
VDGCEEAHRDLRTGERPTLSHGQRCERAQDSSEQAARWLLRACRDDDELERDDALHWTGALEVRGAEQVCMQAQRDGSARIVHSGCRGQARLPRAEKVSKEGLSRHSDWAFTDFQTGKNPATFWSGTL